MLRGDRSLPPHTSEDTILAQTRRVRTTRIATADIIDDEGIVHFRVVSTVWAKIAIVAIVALIMIGFVVLGMVLYNKSEIDNLKRDVDMHVSQ